MIDPSSTSSVKRPSRTGQRSIDGRLMLKTSVGIPRAYWDAQLGRIAKAVPDRVPVVSATLPPLEFRRIYRMYKPYSPRRDAMAASLLSNLAAIC